MGSGAIRRGSTCVGGSTCARRHVSIERKAARELILRPECALSTCVTIRPNQCVPALSKWRWRPSAGSDESKVKTAARKLLADVGTQALIANLGEGLLGNEDPVLVKALVDEIHAASEEMLASA